MATQAEQLQALVAQFKLGEHHASAPEAPEAPAAPPEPPRSPSARSRPAGGATVVRSPKAARLVGVGSFEEF